MNLVITHPIEVTIKRVALLPDVTLGVLLVNGMPINVILERPWQDNQRQVSCIPAGQYICKRVQSPKFGDTFEVTNVPGRSAILFHSGNITEDSQGCIIVGENFAVWKNNVAAIEGSKVGFAEFKTVLDGVNEFPLTILEV